MIAHHLRTGQGYHASNGNRAGPVAAAFAC